MSIGQACSLDILSIPHAMASIGSSFWNAIVRSGYLDVRGEINVSDIVTVLRSRKDITEEWVMHSQDKRCSTGWYVEENKYQVGLIEDPTTAITFTSLEEAVADFIVKELASATENDRKFFATRLVPTNN